MSLRRAARRGRRDREMLNLIVDETIDVARAGSGEHAGRPTDLRHPRDRPAARSRPAAGMDGRADRPERFGRPLLAKQFANAGVGTTPVPVLHDLREYPGRGGTRSKSSGGTHPTSRSSIWPTSTTSGSSCRGLEIARAREQRTHLGPDAGGADRRPLASQFSLTSRMLSDLASIDTPVPDGPGLGRLLSSRCSTPAEVTTVARQIRYRCQTVGGQALIAVHSPAMAARPPERLEDLADVVLHLRQNPRGTGTSTPSPSRRLATDRTFSGSAGRPHRSGAAGRAEEPDGKR